MDKEEFREFLKNNHIRYKEEDFYKIYDTMLTFDKLDENSQAIILEEMKRLKNK
ncbi:TPA: hypothetical protein ACX96U_001186 [Clostridium sporogenes]